MKLSPEGHFELPRRELLDLAQRNPRRLINDILLAGTPFAFEKHVIYCDFREALAERLHVHPCTLVIRGSAKLGYSITPRLDKAWRPFQPESDIDVAIVDVDYFTRLDNEIRSWEGRQRVPHDKAPEYRPYAKRQQYRSFNCVTDQTLPPNTCVSHSDVMERFDTSSYCGVKRGISAFVFRDWWSLRNRYEFDLKALCKAVADGTITTPEDENGLESLKQDEDTPSREAPSAPDSTFAKAPVSVPEG